MPSELKMDAWLTDCIACPSGRGMLAASICERSIVSVPAAKSLCKKYFPSFKTFACWPVAFMPSELKMDAWLTECIACPSGRGCWPRLFVSALLCLSCLPNLYAKNISPPLKTFACWPVAFMPSELKMDAWLTECIACPSGRGMLATSICECPAVPVPSAKFLCKKYSSPFFPPSFPLPFPFLSPFLW